MVSKARARCRRERTVPTGQRRMPATAVYGSSSRSHSAMTSRCCSGSSSMARRNAIVISERAISSVGLKVALASAGDVSFSVSSATQRFSLPEMAADAMTQHAAQIAEDRALRRIEGHGFAQQRDESVVHDVFGSLLRTAHGARKAQQRAAVTLIEDAQRVGVAIGEPGHAFGIVADGFHVVVRGFPGAAHTCDAHIGASAARKVPARVKPVRRRQKMITRVQRGHR